VYNIGGSRFANCSVIEAIKLSEEIAGRPMTWTLDPKPRMGDHVWWISDVRRFQLHYPTWRYSYDLRATLEDVHEGVLRRSLVANT
jgi:CDP-paratose 2-epimerase